VRVVVCGRAPLQAETPVTDSRELRELDPDTAITCLADDGVPAETARFIYQHVGGSPLALRLAGGLTRTESKQGFRDFISSEFSEKLDDELAQAILYRRFLGQIKSGDVKKLAHPGLTLRKITPDLIQHVLAGPCEIQVDIPQRAQELWEELALETALVLQESGGTLRHRPELRRQMVHLLRKNKPEQVQAIHEAAIAYYGARNDTESKAEQFYHMLCLDKPIGDLDAVWNPALEPYLLSAREELPERALIYLSSRSSGPFEAMGTSSDEWREQELMAWERKTAQWARELVRQDQYEEVDKELRRRPDRTPASPLFLLHAQVLIRLGEREEARRVLEAALRNWPPDGSQTERIEMHLLLVRVLLSVGVESEARDQLRQVTPLVQRTGQEEQRLDAATLAVRTAAYLDATESAIEALWVLVESWPDSQFRQVPLVARRAAAELLQGKHRQSAARIIRAVGIGRIDPAEQDRLADAFVLWEPQTQEYRLSQPSRSSGVSFHAGASGDDNVSGRTPSHWLRWLTNTPPVELGDRLARMIEEFPLGELIQRRLYEILLGRHDVAQRRAGEARAAEQKLSRQEIPRRAYELLSDGFSLTDLAFLMGDAMDVRLDNVVPSSSSTSLPRVVIELIKWAERRGQLVELMRAAAAKRPARQDLADFVRAVEASQTQ